MVAPEGWPAVDLTGKKEKLTKNVFKALEKAGIGKLKEGEGVIYVKLPDRLIRVPEHVVATDGRWIPVWVLTDPISEAPMLYVEAFWEARVHPNLTHSPMAIYSPYPIPDIVAHYATADRSALFESQIHLDYKWAKVPGQKEIDLTLFHILRFFGLEVRPSLEGLGTIDRVLGELHWKEDAPAIQWTVLAMGRLTGAIFIGSIGGTWHPRKPDANYAKLEVPIRGPEGGALEVDIMERIEDRIQHGGDGVEALYREVEQRVLSH